MTSPGSDFLIVEVCFPGLEALKARFNFVELSRGELVEVVLHLPHARRLQLPDRLVRNRVLVLRLPDVAQLVRRAEHLPGAGEEPRHRRLRPRTEICLKNRSTPDCV